jgi:hypothetical protein
MTDDEQRRGRPNSPRLKAPAGPLRALVIGLLAARALSWHDLSSDLGRSVTVTVTSYRICVQQGCNRIELGRMTPEPDRTTMPGSER